MRFRVISIVLGLAALTGCSSFESVSMPSSVRERFSPTYQTRIVNADQRTTYEAAKAALKRMDFRFERGGPAQGKLSAIGGLTVSGDMRGARQLSLEVKLTAASGGTEVAALFSEITEDDFSKHPGMGITSPVRQTGIYDVFFQHVESALAAPAK